MEGDLLRLECNVTLTHRMAGEGGKGMDAEILALLADPTPKRITVSSLPREMPFGTVHPRELPAPFTDLLDGDWGGKIAVLRRPSPEFLDFVNDSIHTVYRRHDEGPRAFVKHQSSSPWHPPRHIVVVVDDPKDQIEVVPMVPDDWSPTWKAAQARWSAFHAAHPVGSSGCRDGECDVWGN